MAENGKLPDSDLADTLVTGRLRKDAADSADRMFTKFALDGLGALSAVSPADAYRTFAQQVSARARVGNWAAVPGTSNHGWGKAVDFANGMNSWDSEAQKWFKANGRDFGWVTPGWADPKSDDYEKSEPWHKEFDANLDKGKGPKIRRPEQGEIGLGARSSQVETLQRLLNKNLKPANDIVVDGDFGRATAIAVAKFQSSRGLAVSGTVGGVTQAYLEGRRPEPEPPKPVVIYLKLGSKKPTQVKHLQEFLNRVQRAGLKVDGDFGEKTETAVKIFQGRHVLTRNGKIGPITLAAMKKLGLDL